VIDTHAHLDALDDDPTDVVARARDAGVTRILTVGTDVDGCRRALELSDRYDEVYAILGIHPHAANDATDDDVAEVRSLLAHPKAVAAGEMGLDWFRDYAPRDKQLLLFAAMLEVAAATGKPAVIHTRLVRLVRRKRELPEGGRPAARRARGSGRPDSRRDRRAVPRPAAGARQTE
jgi:TatD DNase family protein